MAHGFKDDDEERRAHMMHALKAAQERERNGGGQSQIGRRIAGLACLAFAVVILVHAVNTKEPADWLGIIFFGAAGIWGLTSNG